MFLKVYRIVEVIVISEYDVNTILLVAVGALVLLNSSSVRVGSVPAVLPFSPSFLIGVKFFHRSDSQTTR